MKKYSINIMAIVFIAVISFCSCTDNKQKEQVNDETKEIEAQSQTLGQDIDENDPEEVGRSSEKVDTLNNDK